MRFSDRNHKFMLDRAAWHELKLTIDGADLKTWLDGELALEYTLGSQPGPGRNNAPPNPDLVPANNAVLRPPVTGKVGAVGEDRYDQLFQRLRRDPNDGRARGRMGGPARSRQAGGAGWARGG